MTAKVLNFDEKKRRGKGGGPPDDDGEDAAPRGATGILERIVQNMKLIRDPSGRLFAVVGSALLPVDSPRFKGKLAHLYHEATRKDCGEAPIKKILLRIDGGETVPGLVPLRFAYDASGAIWVDGIECGVKISPRGVEVADQPALAFYRPDGMAPLPKPIIPRSADDAGKALQRLWAHLQLTPKQAHVAFAWLVAAVLPERDLTGKLNRFPVLCVVGSHGSGKTSKIDMLRQMVDPRWPLHTDFPATLRDFAIAAENQRVLAYDNISKITPLVSDGLCRRATGDGIEIRQLYTDRGMTTLTGSNPAMINTITDSVLSAPDLQSRSLMLDIGMMKRGRKTDELVAKEFAALWPGALGALYYAVSRALKDVASTEPPLGLRMSSAAAWGIAAAPAVGFTRGNILAAYRGARALADAITFDQPVPRALEAWRRVRKEKAWRGSTGQLLGILKDLDTHSDGGTENNASVAFPRTPEGLRGALKRLEPVLHRSGIHFDWRTIGSHKNGRNFGITFGKAAVKGDSR